MVFLSKPRGIIRHVSTVNSNPVIALGVGGLGMTERGEKSARELQGALPTRIRSSS